MVGEEGGGVGVGDGGEVGDGAGYYEVGLLAYGYGAVGGFEVHGGGSGGCNAVEGLLGGESHFDASECPDEAHVAGG